MERKALSIALRDWFLLGLILTPFLVASFLLGKVEIVSLLDEFWEFVRGDIEGISHITFTASTVPTIMVFMIIGITAFAVVNNGIAVTIGMPTYSKKMEREMARPLLELLLLTVIIGPLVEETVFRGVFLWLIPYVWHGNTALLILVIIGSLCFSAIHFWNYEKSKGFFLKGIPFFIVSFFLAFVFLEYGILAAFLAHAIYNFVEILRVKGSNALLGGDIKNDKRNVYA